MKIWHERRPNLFVIPALFSSLDYFPGGDVLQEAFGCPIIKYVVTKPDNWGDRRHMSGRSKKKVFGTRIVPKCRAQISKVVTFQVIASIRMQSSIGTRPQFFASRRAALAFVKSWARANKIDYNGFSLQ